MYRNFLILAVSLLTLGGNLNGLPHLGSENVSKDSAKITGNFGFLEWQALDSPHIRLYFPPGMEAKAWTLLNKLEKHVPLINAYAGKLERTVLVLDDFGNISNGYANPIANKMSVWTYPISSTGFIAVESWLELVSVHELAHIAQLTNSNNNLAIQLFGVFFSPNIMVPRWFAEGLAVNVESAIDNYQGRLNHPRARVITYELLLGGKIKKVADLFSPMDTYPKGEIPYLVGGRFMAYITDQFGKEAMVTFIEKMTGDPFSNPLDWMLQYARPSEGMDVLAKEVFGASFSDLFYQWKVMELAHPPTKQGKVLLKSPERKQWALNYNDTTLIYGRELPLDSHPNADTRLASIDALELKSLQSKQVLTFISSLVCPPVIKDDYLYGGVRNYAPGFHNTSNRGYGGVTSLVRVDINQPNIQKVLITDEIRAFMVLDEPDESIVFVKDSNHHTQSEIWLKQAKEEPKKLGKIPILVSEMIAFDNKWVVVGKRPGELWDIYSVHPDTLELTQLTRTPFPEGYISKFSKDSTLFLSTIDKKTNVFRMNINSGKIEQITDVTYAMYPIRVGDNLIYMRPGTDGTQVVKEPLKAEYPTVTFSPPKTEKSQLVTHPHIKPVHAGLSNTASLFDPWLKLFPYTALGGDHLETTRYAINILPSSWTLAATYSGWRPLHMYVGTTSYWSGKNRQTVWQADAPLYKSGLAGLQAVNANMYYQSVELDDALSISGASRLATYGSGLSAYYWDGFLKGYADLKHNMVAQGFSAEVGTRVEWKGASIDAGILTFQRAYQSLDLRGEHVRYSLLSGTKIAASYQQLLLNTDTRLTLWGVTLNKLFGTVYFDGLYQAEGVYSLPTYFNWSEGSQSYSTLGVATELQVKFEFFSGIPAILETGAYIGQDGYFTEYARIKMESSLF